MINIELVNNTIYKNNIIIFESKYPIEKILSINSLERVILVIKAEYYEKYGDHLWSNENIFCFDYDGNLIWRIPKFELGEKNSKSSYVDIDLLQESQVKATNYDGGYAILDIKNGDVILTPMQSMIGTRPW